MEAMAASLVGAVVEEAIIVVVRPLLEELLSRVKKHLHFVMDLKDEIRFLRGVLPKLTKAIWSAEVEPEIAEMRKALQGFVEGAKDILHEYDTRTARRHHRRFANKIKLKVRGLIPSPLRFANKIKKLYDELGKVKTDLEKIRLFVASAEEGLRLAQGQTDQLHRRPIIDEVLRRDFRFIGRENKKKEVVAGLLSEPLSKPSVILVTGMGGIGKTTLAQNIFRDLASDQRFEIKKWVCVGDELDPGAVMAKISGQTIRERIDMCSELKGKRFLIVLDDCWKGKLGRWNELWEPLTHGSDGSKVLITCREDITKELVAIDVKKYELDALSNKECLQIFESYAFPDKESSGSYSTSRLQNNEKEILNEKIKGLPLAARVLGSSLRNVIRGKWINVLNGVVHNDIMSVLMWSYRRLPWYLKQCFAYLSVFPKDYRLQKEHVVWMWMAHDYVQPKDKQTSEDIGKSYFDDLVGASLIQKIQDDEERDVYYKMHDDDESDVHYKMHDLVHDLATIVSIDGCFPYKHLSITDNKSFNEYFDNKKKPRTLLIFWKDSDITKLELQYVRVLLISWRQHLARINFDEMIHLRYLDLTIVEAGTLPECICSVYNLQTLLLNYQVENFPLGKWNLPNLRHLLGGHGYTREEDGIRMTGISNSKSLGTISCFNLFQEGEDIKELANLKELRKLGIYHLNRVTSPLYVLEAQLDDKEYIEELTLNWGQSNHHMTYEGTTDMIQDGILENLRPHQSLRSLEILNYGGDQLPSWMSSNHLPHLVELKLWHLCHVVELPPLGHLPSLEHLLIQGLRNVSCIGDGFYGTGAYVFPSLKVLKLRAMDGLEEWEDSDRHKKDGISTWFPSLEYLTIWNCEMLRSMPCLNPRCLKQMTINNTELEALPEIIRSSDCTDGHPEYCCDIPRLQELSIMDCRSLRPEEWFGRHRMPALEKLRLNEVGSCTNLVINYSRKCLTYMVIWRMEGLRLIRLSNIAPLDESGEAHYPSLSVELIYLFDMEEMSMVNSEDGKITAGPLQLRADGWYGARRVVENLLKMMLQDQDYSLKNAVECLVTYGINSRHGLLRVEPRSK